MDLHNWIASFGLTEFADAFVDPANVAGHIAYVLLIVSMLMRTMVWLRLFAIAAGTFSAVYYFTLGDFVSFFWESIFSLVNAVQLLILFIENRRGRFSAEESAFIEKILKGVERAQVRRLMHLGAWIEVGKDFQLIQEETEPNQLIYIVKGKARVEREGRLVGTAGPGDFLGEMSYLSGRNATATVTTETPLRYLAFDRATLRQHLARNAETRHAMEAAFNRNLVEKLVKTSRDLHASGVVAALDDADGGEHISGGVDGDARATEELLKITGESDKR
jgi:CRP-like cAMP-binding protein